MCPNASDNFTRCDDCTLDRMDQAEASEAGQLLNRALRLKSAMKLGLTVTLADIAADEFVALQILEEERERYEAEKPASS